MIAATELRLFNYLLYDNLYVRVSAIWANGNYEVHSEELQGWTIDEEEQKSGIIKGIPLTPEILVNNCGFGSQGNFVDADWYYKLIGIRTNHNGVCCFELTLFKTQYEDFGINLEEQYFGYCKYLHQLQNKYFALTGEELEINLNPIN